MLDRSLENKFRELDAKLSKRLQQSGEDSETTTPGPGPLTIPPRIARRLAKSFNTALEEKFNGSGLSLKDAYNGMSYHSDRSLGTVRPGDTEETIRAPQKYLHLMKSLFLLDKIKTSTEYTSKIRSPRYFAWFVVIDKLEKVSPVRKPRSSIDVRQQCGAQLRRYTAEDAEDDGFPIPSDEEIDDLGREDFTFSFDDDQSPENDVSLGITSSHTDEISYL